MTIRKGRKDVPVTDVTYLVEKKDNNHYLPLRWKFVKEKEFCLGKSKN